MTPEKQQQLFDKYPELFKQRGLPMSQTYMCWGIEVGDGWYKLIDSLCEFITNHYKCNPEVINTELADKLYKEWKTLINNNNGKEADKVYKQMRSNEEVLIPQVIQVKEKYGTLRFYLDSSSDYLEGAVSFAEDLSYHVCESCGTMKNVSASTGWISVRCNNCRKKEGE